MASIIGTETEKNLLKAFAGESQARNRYTYFSSVARKEGYVQIADIFEETANQEKDRHSIQDSTEQTIGEFALQVETFMKEAEVAAIERPALALLAAFSLGIIVGQMFSRR